MCDRESAAVIGLSIGVIWSYRLSFDGKKKQSGLIMSRVQLEQLNIDGLREVARQHGLDIHGARAVLFDRITDHFERQGWPETISILPSITEDRQVVEQEAQAVQEVVANAGAGEQPPRGQTAEAGRLSGRGISVENAFDLQDIVRAVVQALNVA